MPSRKYSVKSSIRIPKTWICERIDPLIKLKVFKSRPDSVERTILNLLKDRENWPKIEQMDELTVKVSKKLIDQVRKIDENADKVIRSRLYMDLENAWNEAEKKEVKKHGR